MKFNFKKLLGDPQAKTVKRLRKRVASVNALGDKYKKMSDSKLKEQTDVLKKRLKKESLDAILPDAFAVVREAADRVIGQRHFDVQLIGGMVLHEGNVAEMKTGEGKTLMATAPVYLNALTEKGVHVVTVNDYLAQRDAGWMGQVYHFLGLTTAVIKADHSYIYDPKFESEEHEDPRMKHLRPISRQEAYAADITYGTNNEYGFDYLRDNVFDGGPKMRHWIESAGAWAPLVYIALKASTYVIAPLSGTPVKLAGGALFGFWEGAILGLTGDMIGASLNFWIARLFRDKAITKLSGRRAIKQIDELTEHVGGWRALLAARIFLASLYDFISYAAGLSKLPFKQFFLVSLLAGIPSTLMASWLGNAAVTNKSFLYILFSISAAGLVALLFMQRFQKK